MFFCREKNIKEELNVLSWNLDGLEEDYRTERTNAAIKIIIEKKPDVVLLQEVVTATYLLLVIELDK